MSEFLTSIGVGVGLMIMVAIVVAILLRANDAGNQRRVREYRRPSPGPGARGGHQQQSWSNHNGRSDNGVGAETRCNYLKHASGEDAEIPQAVIYGEYADLKSHPLEFSSDQANEWDPEWNHQAQPAPQPFEDPAEAPIEVPNWPVRVGWGREEQERN